MGVSQLLCRAFYPVPVAVLTLAVLGGCPIQVAGLPDGIYSGATSVTVTVREGSESETTTASDPQTIVIRSDGLPQWTDVGDPPESGLQTVAERGGILTVRETITVVATSENRVVVKFDAEMTLNGVRMTGTGTTTYTFRPPNQLDYVNEFNVVGTSAGQVAVFRRIESGTLTK